MRVAALLNCKGHLLALYADEATAREKADAYNADRFLDAETPDADAPYSVEVWRVQS